MEAAGDAPLDVRIGYLAQDLADPAIERRIRMLQAGGANVTIAGFNRGTPRTSVSGASALTLGRTQGGRLASRVLSVLAALVTAPAWARRFDGADILLARNLESLVLAHAARRARGLKAPVIYELLDVHRLLLGEGVVGRALRALERSLLAATAGVIVSSPAFVEAYLEPRQHAGGKARLVENKLFGVDIGSEDNGTREPQAPWRIGWFGMIRCRCSLELLRSFAATHAGLVEVVIGGRPSYDQIPDFDAQVRGLPNLSFAGAYAAGDLRALYRRVHFAWAIDYFEAGANSRWLLPNRLYEAQGYGAVPIADRAVETGRWLARHDAGLLLDDPARDLAPAIAALDAESYGGLARRTAAIPVDDLVCSIAACRELVRWMRRPQ